MEPVASAAVEGLVTTLSWPNVAYPILGTLLAMVASLLPGISGVTLMILVIPLTLYWEPLEIMLLFGALVGGATFMGSVSAILINVPGRTSNTATMLDGYPLSQQGKAKTAIACSATASALGSTIGVLVLILLIPYMIPMVLSFGPLELLAAVIWGLSTIASVVQGSWLKGMIMAGLGLAVSFVGVDPQTAESRFTFDFLYLADGMPPVIVFLGLFAVAEMLQLMLSKAPSVSGQLVSGRLGGSISEGICSVFKNLFLFLRCSAIGVGVGMMPGVGSVVASFLAYGHASHSRNGRFGEGDIRGVIAPEAANDAKDGGSLVPTLAFGIPGGLGTAMLLTAFVLHGINPGRDLLTDQLPLVFVLIWSLFLSNWMTSLLGLAGVNWFARLTVVPKQILAPVVLVLVVLSAYAYRERPADAVLVLCFALAGLYFKKYNWPRAPFVIALVLGPYFENNLRVCLQLRDLGRLEIESHPIALALILLTAVSLAVPWWRSVKRPGRRTDRRDSIGLGVLLAVAVGVMATQLAALSANAMLAPKVVLGLTLSLLALYVASSARGALGDSTKRNGATDTRALKDILIASSLFVATWLLGPTVAVALFVCLYGFLRLELPLAQAGLWALSAAAGAYGMIHVLLGRTTSGALLWDLDLPAVLPHLT